MFPAIDAELKAAAVGLFSDEELADIFSNGVPESRPAPVKIDTRSFAERLQAAREAEDRARLYAKRMVQVDVRTVDPAILAELDAIGTDDEARMLGLPVFRMSALTDRELAESRAAYTARTRNAGGRIWDLLPPGSAPRAGDEIEDEGIWRPRPVIADYKTRYDRAIFQRCEAQHAYDADPSESAQNNLEVAWRRQCEALQASDDETVQERDRIDVWRAGEGREFYNASRRTVRASPNADLSGMTAEEKAAHEREQARLRKQRSRERAKADAIM